MKNLFKSIAAFQFECPAIGKSTKAYNYKYADLPTIIEIIKPILQKHNLGFTQLIETVENNIGVKTILFETTTGESIETTVFAEIPDFKGMTKIQSLGSIITYLRRYSLSSILGIVTDEDNDGNYSQTEKKEQPKQPLLLSEANLQNILKTKDVIKIESWLATEVKKGLQISESQQIQINNHINNLKSQK